MVRRDGTLRVLKAPRRGASNSLIGRPAGANWSSDSLCEGTQGRRKKDLSSLLTAILRGGSRAEGTFAPGVEQWIHVIYLRSPSSARFRNDLEGPRVFSPLTLHEAP
jgi:hypothetical protein